ncbi:iron chaperone [Dietzia sp.]|uniref:iron chaperone n=1 Tax=Dietzia sp. TaxID=1871616 RepID=UPI002FD9DEBC
MSTPTDPDSYIEAAPEVLRPALVQLRSARREALPEAKEIFAYGMPGFSVHGKTVAGYAEISKQDGLYVLAPAISENAEAIKAAGYRASKTGVTFQPSKPLPDDLAAKLARSSLEHVDD